MLQQPERKGEAGAWCFPSGGSVGPALVSTRLPDCPPGARYDSVLMRVSVNYYSEQQSIHESAFFLLLLLL